MRLYLAASDNGFETDNILKTSQKDVLFSYHYYQKNAHWKRINKFLDRNIFLDSGAFSAHTKGVHIDIIKYCDFIKKLGISDYAVLDVIGDNKSTMDNIAIMQKEGLNPWPVFHMGSNLDDLKYYLDNYNKLALGGMVSSPNLNNWLVSVWQEILTRAPQCKIHGFGLTSQEKMQSYPFYSCDSSSWCSFSRYGQIYRWSQEKKILYTQRIEDFFKENNLQYTKGKPIPKASISAAIVAIIEVFQKLENHVTEVHKKSNFSHLVDQLKLF